VYHKPFVDWIWGGAFLMALGGVLAVTDRRYRLARREQAQASARADPVAPSTATS
jgi:cytochrome c-type biogenesis protein CcmF